jgi:hypothetical protein
MKDGGQERRSSGQTKLRSAHRIPKVFPFFSSRVSLVSRAPALSFLLPYFFPHHRRISASPFFIRASPYVFSMSCQHNRSTRPRAVLATLATLPILFTAQAWAAPHSLLVRRDSSGGGSKIVVCPLSLTDPFSPRSASYRTSRPPSSQLSSFSSAFQWCFTGTH